MCCILVVIRLLVLFCFFKQKTAYEMRISDWSSDVCSSDLMYCYVHSASCAPAVSARHPLATLCRASLREFAALRGSAVRPGHHIEEDREVLQHAAGQHAQMPDRVVVTQPLPGIEHDAAAEIGRASCRERGCPTV